VLIYLRGLGFSTDRRPPAPNDPAEKQAAPPPVPPSGPWGPPKK